MGCVWRYCSGCGCLLRLGRTCFPFLSHLVHGLHADTPLYGRRQIPGPIWIWIARPSRFSLTYLGVHYKKNLPPPGIVYQHLSQSSFQFLSWTFISLFFPRSRYLFDSYAIRPSSNSWERFSVLCFDGDSFGAFFVWLLRLRRRRLYHCSLDILYITTTTHHPSSIICTTPRHRRSFSVLPFGVETLECLLFCLVGV